MGHSPESKEKQKQLLEEVLDLKAQGWSDVQIRKELKLLKPRYDRLLKLLHKEHFFQAKALGILSETVHRLSWCRMQALRDYQAYRYGGEFKFGNEVKVVGQNANASMAALRRVIEIDVSIPKVCEQLGWNVRDLEKIAFPDKRVKGSEALEVKNLSEDDLYDEYRRLARLDA